MLEFLAYMVAIILLMLAALFGHEIGDYLVQNDQMAAHKGALNADKNKKWNWRQVLHLLFTHKHCKCGGNEKHSDSRKDYLHSLKWNAAHAVSYTLTIGVLFVGTSYLLEFVAAQKFEAEFNPVELVGWTYFIGWMVVNAVLHGFIDCRWPVKALMYRTGQQEYFDKYNGAPAVDQASHKACLYVTTFALPLLAAL